MYLKTVASALFFLLPMLSVNNVQADEYLLLSNLPPEPTVGAIRKLVEPHGSVRTINCVDTKFSNRVQKNCYVLMWTSKNAQKVVSELNGKMLGNQEMSVSEIYPLPCLKDLKIM